MIPGCGCKAVPSELLAALFRFQQIFWIQQIKFVAGITGVIHDDLGCHRELLSISANISSSTNLAWSGLGRINTALLLLRQSSKTATTSIDSGSTITISSFAM